MPSLQKTIRSLVSKEFAAKEALIRKGNPPLGWESSLRWGLAGTFLTFALFGVGLLMPTAPIGVVCLVFAWVFLVLTLLVALRDVGTYKRATMTILLSLVVGCFFLRVIRNPPRNEVLIAIQGIPDAIYNRLAPLFTRTAQPAVVSQPGPRYDPRSDPPVERPTVRNSTPLQRPRPRHLELIFKDSTLFTTSRREFISDTLESFYSYLTDLGFTIPVRLPPLGVNASGSAQGGTFPGDPVYDYGIGIGKDSMDKPIVICGLYAQYWFGNILKEHDISPAWSNRVWMTAVVADYYARSKTNVPPDEDYKGFNGWVPALWEVRQDVGSQFMDKAMFYVVGSPEPESNPHDMEMIEFNRYLWTRLIRGINVIDNDYSRSQRITKILKARGLTP
jgi:hypothetical protein